jgi:hypothetical protein
MGRCSSVRFPPSGWWSVLRRGAAPWMRQDARHDMDTARHRRCCCGHGRRRSIFDRASSYMVGTQHCRKSQDGMGAVPLWSARAATQRRPLRGWRLTRRQAARCLLHHICQFTHTEGPCPTRAPWPTTTNLPPRGCTAPKTLWRRGGRRLSDPALPMLAHHPSSKPSATRTTGM